MSLKCSLLLIFLTPSALMIVSLSILLYFHYIVIDINVEYVQKGLYDDKNDMILKRLARIKQVLEMQYGSLTSDFYLAVQFQQKILNQKVQLNLNNFNAPSLNINKYISGQLTSEQNQLYTKSKLLFDFWYKQGINEETELSQSQLIDYTESVISSIIFRTSAKIRRTIYNYPSYSQYFISNNLLKFLPPPEDSGTFIKLVDECSKQGNFENCQNYFSETYLQDSLRHTSPSDEDIKKQISHICSPVYKDPESKRQILNNQKSNLNYSDSFETLLSEKLLTQPEKVRARQRYDTYLKQFKLSEEQVNGQTTQISINGVETDYETENGIQNFLVQQIVISFKDRKSKQFNKYNLYNIVSWIDKSYLIEDSTQMRDLVSRFIVASYLVCAFVIFFILGVSMLQAVNIQQQTEKPIDELTQILKNINTDIFNETKETHSLEYNLQLEADLDEISDSFSTCHELNVLFETFRQLFQTIQFANEAYFQGDSASSLMHWSKASIFFENIKNIRAQGISLNNLGNIHFKENRFEEALNCYEESINLADQEIDDNFRIREDVPSLNKDCFSIKLNRVIQFLQALIMFYIDNEKKIYNNKMKLSDEFLEYFTEKLSSCETSITELLPVLDVDLKRDSICYLMLTKCYDQIKLEDIALIYLSKTENILYQINQKEYQGEYSLISPSKTNTPYLGNDCNTSAKLSLIQTPLSQIDMRQGKFFHRQILNTQISLVQLDEQQSNLIIPNSKVSYSSSATYTTTQQNIFQNLTERKNNILNKFSKIPEETIQHPSLKGIISPVKSQSKLHPPLLRPYPQILQRRFNKVSLNNSISLCKEEDTIENLSKEEGQLWMEDEYLNTDQIHQIPTQYDSFQAKNPFENMKNFQTNNKNNNEMNQEAQKSQNLLEDLTKNLPSVPSIQELDIIIEKVAKSNVLQQQSYYGDEKLETNGQEVNDDKHNLSYLEVQTTNAIDTIQFSFEKVAKTGENLDNTTFNFLNNSQTPEKDNHVLLQAVTPELPPIKLKKKNLTLQIDQSQIEEIKLKSQLNQPDTTKQRSFTQNLSIQGDSPLGMGRQKRQISQNLQTRGKNLSIFNKSSNNQIKVESIFNILPLDVLYQKYYLLKARIHLSNRELIESAEMATLIFENFYRYELLDRVEALKILKQIFKSEEEKILFKEVEQKFQEVTWDVKIIIHEQISDQSYKKVEQCIQNVQEIIQKQTPNKLIKNKYSIYLNNDIQEELLPISHGTFKFSFMSNLNSILKNSFCNTFNSQLRKESSKESCCKLTQQQEEHTTLRITIDDVQRDPPINFSQQKIDLQNQHSFVSQAIHILKQYTEQSLKQNHRMEIINNPFQLQFHALVEQLNDAKFVNLFLVIWKSIYKFYGQDLYELSKFNKQNVNSSQQQKSHENLIFSIHDASDDKNIYDTVFILYRMKQILLEFNIKVIMRILIKESFLVDLVTQYQTVKQAAKYVQKVKLTEIISVFGQSNKFHSHLMQIKEPMKYLGHPILIEKI